VVIRDTNTQETRRLELSGLFFAIGHAPATAFLNGQLALDEFNYIITQPGRTTTSVPGGLVGWGGVGWSGVFELRAATGPAHIA
jgi:thioredoxin reductase